MLLDAGDGLIIEQVEHAPISLRPTGEHLAVQEQNTLSTVDYDAAQRRRLEGQGDASGLEIERAELSLEPHGEVQPLEVESFWGAEPMGASPEPVPNAEPAPEPPAADGDSMPDDAYGAGEYLADPFAIREPEGLQFPIAAAPEPDPGVAGTADGDASEAEADVSVAASGGGDVEAAAGGPDSGAAAGEVSGIATPDNGATVAPPPDLHAAVESASADAASLVDIPAPGALAHAGSGVDAVDDAVAALEEAFAEPATPERPPRWATPRVVEAFVERPVPPVEPAAAPANELSAALGWPAQAPAQSPNDAPDASDVDVSRELMASVAGWRPVANGARTSDAVAAALERIASRVRAGELPLPSDVALATSDEGALAVALAALLRGGARS